MNDRPLTILMITPTDYARMWNNVEHGRVRVYDRMGHSVTVLHLTLNRSSRLWDLLRDTCTWRVTPREEGPVRFIAVDPFFNYCAGLRVQAEYRSRARRHGVSVRDLLIKALSPLTVLRDLFFIPCFVGAALWKLPGTYDVCLGIGPWGSIVGWFLKLRGKVRLLVYEDRDFERALAPGRLRSCYTQWIERFCLKRASQVISVGHRLAAIRRQETGRPVEVIPNGVDWNRFASARDARSGNRTLVHVGNLVAWSGLELTLEAMPDILRECPDARLMIIGGGLPAYEAYLRQLVHRLGLMQAVEFCGSIPNDRLPELLARASVGLSNSRPDTVRTYACPLKVMEYMAAGLPVITTKNSEAADIVERCGIGLAVPYEAAALAQAAAGLLQDDAHYDRLRGNAIRKGREFDWQRLLEKELTLIRDMRPPPAAAQHGSGLSEQVK